MVVWSWPLRDPDRTCRGMSVRGLRLLMLMLLVMAMLMTVVGMVILVVTNLAMIAIDSATANNITGSCDIVSMATLLLVLVVVVIVVVMVGLVSVAIAGIRVEIAQGMGLLDLGSDKILTPFENILRREIRRRLDKILVAQD